MLRFFAILGALLSLTLVWSETTFNVDRPILSIPAIILLSPDIGNAATEVCQASAYVIID